MSAPADLLDVSDGRYEERLLTGRSTSYSSLNNGRHGMMIVAVAFTINLSTGRRFKYA